MTQSKKAMLLGQIAHLEAVGHDRPSDEHSFFSSGRSSRIESLREELIELEKEAPAASVMVTFEGKSVSGSSSIGVSLLTRTMGSLKQAVGLLVGSIVGLPKTASGRSRSANIEDPQFTSIALGSFGYELSTRNPTEFWSAENTGLAIDQAMRLLDMAAKDESGFYKAIEA